MRPRIRRHFLPALVSAALATLAIGQAPGGEPAVRKLDVGRLMAAATAIGFSPTGETVFFSGHAQRTLEVHAWDADGVAKPRRIAKVSDVATEAAAFSPDGRRFAYATGTVKGEIRPSWGIVEMRSYLVGPFELKIAELETGRVVHTLRGSALPIERQVFSADGRRVAGAVGRAGGMVVWDVESGKPLVSMPTAHADAVADVSFSPDGARLASVSADDSVKLWDVESGRELRTLTGQFTSQAVVRFSADGRLLAACGPGDVIKIWDVDSGREAHTISAGPAVVLGLAFSPNRRWLLGATALMPKKRFEGGEVRVWSVETGREVRRWAGDKNFVGSVVLSPDGRKIAWFGNGRSVTITESAFLEQ